MSLLHQAIQNISKYANIRPAANWTIVYFNQRVQNDVMAMPAGVLIRTIVVLHSFVKKSQDTPDREMRMARQRLKDIQHG